MRECDGAACGQEAAYPAAPLLCLPLLVVSVADQLKEEGSREWRDLEGSDQSVGETGRIP